MKLDRGFHFSVEARAGRMNANRANKPYTGAIFAKVLNSYGDTERAVVSSVVGDKTINFSYPFASASGWIRGQPEPTTTMVAVIGGDTGDLQPIGYYDPLKSAAASFYATVAAGIRQTGSTGGTVPTTVQPYRVLNPGEIDSGSEFAQTFMGLRDGHQSRGGLSHTTMTSLYTSVETPLYTIKGPGHQTGPVLKDETRFGTVRRAVPGTSTSTQPGLVKKAGINVRDSTAPVFAKEHTVVLDWFGNVLQSKLIDHRQGHVYEDAGQAAISGRNGKNLRARFQWFTLASNTNAEIDENGNFVVTTAAEATDGGVVNIATGNFLMNALQKLTFQSKTNDIEFSTGPLSRFVVSAGSAGVRIATPGRYEVDATTSVGINSLGQISLNTPTPSGISLGVPGGVKYPVLVANKTYLTTHEGWLTAEGAMLGMLQAYATAAAAAWGAVGPLMIALDPTGSVSALCAAAGSAAFALSPTVSAANAALGLYVPTLTPMPGGYVSMRTVSE